MNPIFKKLASETVVYGMSTMLARMLNFLLVPLYTRMLTQSEYGVVSEMFTYIAVLQVVLVMGLETGCFRFASKSGDPDKVFSSAFMAVLGVVLPFLLAVLVMSDPIASGLGYEGYGRCFRYMGWVLALDSLTAILFARLRTEHKSMKFAVLKTVKILTESGVNLFLFLWYPAQPSFTYPVFAVMVSCVVVTLLLVPEFLKHRFIPDRKMMGTMLAYSLPLMVASLPGIVNEFVDRIMFRFCDTSSEQWRASLGVYSAALKLAVLMNLFVQMYRYAAEPFFFQREKDGDSRLIYARLMEYLTAVCGVVFLGVIFYMDVISLFLGKDFREGLAAVPLLLGANMLLGMNFNVSMWYKLSERTWAAVYITLAGLVVTFVINLVFMPVYSYYASAWAHLLSAATMFGVSAVWGQRRYPIPYNWGRVAVLVGLMLALYALGMGVDAFVPHQFAAAAVKTLLLLMYVAGAVYLLRGRRIRQEGTR